MVMLRYGGGIVEINGKVGGEIYRRDRCGNHKQVGPYKKQRANEAQEAIRRAFMRCSAYWGFAVDTPGAQLSWWLYSQSHLKTNKKGETYYLPARQCFIAFNMPRVLNGLEIMLTWDGT